MATIHLSKTKKKTTKKSVTQEVYEGLTEGEAAVCWQADELGQLEEEIAEAQTKLANSKPFKALQVLQAKHGDATDAVRAACGYKKGAVADDDIDKKGEYFRATLGKSSNSTTVIDKKGLVAWIEKNFSKEELMELVKFGITELRSYLPKKAFEKFTKTERTGTRKLSLKRHTDA
jgi:hypothetical protein